MRSPTPPRLMPIIPHGRRLRKRRTAVREGSSWSSSSSSTVEETINSPVRNRLRSDRVRCTRLLLLLTTTRRHRRPSMGRIKTPRGPKTVIAFLLPRFCCCLSALLASYARRTRPNDYAKLIRRRYRKILFSVSKNRNWPHARYIRVIVVRGRRNLAETPELDYIYEYRENVCVFFLKRARKSRSHCVDEIGRGRKRGEIPLLAPLLF